MEKKNNIYDILACICFFINQLSIDEKKYIYQDYFTDQNKHKKYIEEKIDFLNRKSILGKVYYDQFNDDEIRGIFDKIIQWSKTNNDKKYLVAMLSYLEDYIDFEASFERFISNECNDKNEYRSCFIALNSNTKDTYGKLLPCFNHNWKKNSKRSPSSLNADPISVMKKYIWIENFKEWSVKNLYIHKLKADSSFLRIACSPLSSQCPFDIKYEEIGANFFHIKYKEEQDMFVNIKNILSHISATYDSNPKDILVFPEMMSSLNCLENSQKYISENWMESYPPLIFLPTCEYEVSPNKWVNSLKVLNNRGEEVFVYNKQNPFQLDKDDKKYFEHIMPDKKITIIHVKGIGRIGVLICSDVFDINLTKFLFEEIKISLLLVQAYSEGIDMFFQKMQQASCDVVWCNACAAHTRNNNEVVAYLPKGHKYSNTNYTVKNKCDKECQGCLKEVIIPLSYECNEMQIIDELLGR